VVEVAIANRRYGLAAWSIGGDELGNPPEPFAPVFERARQGGLRTMAHAGEVVGAGSVWGAVDVLKAERIGHGIRCVEDPQLVQYLCDRQVVLDVCPTSNLLTGAAPSLAAHPLRQLYEAGVRISINTDDPIFFHTTMNDEYRLAAHAFGFSAHELAMVMLDSVRATFLPEAEKAVLVAEFERDLATLGAW
jgi:adenosine deaminase